MAKRLDRLPEPLRVAVVAAVDGTVLALLAGQVRAMERAGYEVRCLCTPGWAQARLIDGGFQMVAVRIKRRISPLSDLAAIWQMYRYFRREGVAVVHTHTPKPGLLGQIAAWLAGVPVVVNTIHGFYFHDHTPPLKRRFYIAMERLAARFSSAILSQNPEDVDTGVELKIAPREKWSVLGNGIHLSRFDPGRFDATHRTTMRSDLGIPAEAVVVLIVARQVREKGFLELFEAMRGVMARHRDVHLVVVGPPDPEKRDCIDRSSMSRFGIDEKTHWLGRRDDVPELLACANIYVLPSWREGFPRSAMEAAAMGLPIVATDIRGCRQVVEHERTGLLVPSRDAAALERAIERMVQCPDMRIRFGADARRKALSEFDERRVCEIILRTYAEALAKKGLQPPRAPGKYDAV